MFKIKIILALLVISLLIISAKVVVAEPIEIVPTPTFEQEMKRIFGNDYSVAMAVLQHESQFNERAKNWNCIYNGKSTFCKVEDRHKAWSIDCGFAQINVRGQVCPEELMTKEGSLPYIENIYNIQGLNAWISYRTGAYKSYLK